MGKMFQFMLFTFPENAWKQGIFTHGQSTTQNSRYNFWKICFTHSKEDGRGGGSYDLLYQNLIKKYEDDLEHDLI